MNGKMSLVFLLVLKGAKTVYALSLKYVYVLKVFHWKVNLSNVAFKKNFFINLLIFSLIGAKRNAIHVKMVTAWNQITAFVTMATHGTAQQQCVNLNVIQAVKTVNAVLQIYATVIWGIFGVARNVSHFAKILVQMGNVLYPIPACATMDISMILFLSTYSFKNLYI